MIVTCPSCNAKYRVRDDAVPHGGAQLKCPECSTMFLAHRPAHDDRELTSAIDRLTKQNHEAEGRIHDLEKRVKDVGSDAERQKAEFRRLNEEAGRALAVRDREIADLKQELARGSGQLVEISALKDALIHAQQTSARLTSELDSQRGVIAHLQEELQRARQSGGAVGRGPSGDTAALEQTVQQLRSQLDDALQKVHRAAPDGPLLALIGAVSPMLWGLDQAIRYLEPFSANEPTLAAHLRQLQLLAGVLKRLTEAAGAVPGHL